MCSVGFMCCVCFTHMFRCVLCGGVCGVVCVVCMWYTRWYGVCGLGHGVRGMCVRCGMCVVGGCEVLCGVCTVHVGCIWWREVYT